MGGLFTSESSSTVDTRNYTDSFNSSVSAIFSPTKGGDSITINVGSGASATGNAYVDGLTKLAPVVALALIAWAFMKR